MNTVDKFEQWCVIEIMGHKRFAGFVTEQSVGGASFVRVDVPEVTTRSGETLPAFTKLFGASSIYCLSPCTEETARAFAADLRAEGFALYEAPRLPAPQAAPVRDAEWDDPETFCEGCGCEIDSISIDRLCADCTAKKATPIPDVSAGPYDSDMPF